MLGTESIRSTRSQTQLEPEKISVSSQSKCILTGAYSVLRGKRAVACSIAPRLKLEFESRHNQYGVVFNGLRNQCAEERFTPFFEHALQLCNRTWQDFPGIITLENQVPIGSGLGSSAALCCAVAKLFAQQHMIKPLPQNIERFAHRLEHYFHGQSSGIDIIASSTPAGQITLLEDKKYIQKQALWRPYLSLCSSGVHSNTKESIQSVDRWRKSNPDLADQVDNHMHNSSLLAEEALTTRDLSDVERGKLLINSLELSHNCYNTWGLIPEATERKIKQLESNGALSSTLTGGGHGGHILSLWHKKPTAEIQSKLKLIWVF